MWTRAVPRKGSWATRRGRVDASRIRLRTRLCRSGAPVSSRPAHCQSRSTPCKAPTARQTPSPALLLRFTDAAKASAYRTGYQNRMAACGEGGDLSVKQLWVEDTAAAALRRYAGDEAEQYVDVSVVQGSTVALLAAASAQPDTQS